MNKIASEIILLDLNKVKLLGYECGWDKCIDSVIKGIQSNDVFPPVNVLRLDDGSYLLVPPDGGHTRAIGHYITNKPLRVIVVSPDEVHPDYSINGRTYGWFRDGILRDDLGKVRNVGELLIKDDCGQFDIKSSAGFYRK